ncbi:MAG: hypothetical protein MUO54_15735, partial [Anaerolineales bacterium]|nr:hypothetical protein [Anaerolineales bacterium]
MTTRSYSHFLRAACAEARALLIQLAGEHLHIDPANLKVNNGVVYDAANPEKKVSYGWLTKGQRIERPMDEKPEVKDYTEFHYVGQSF